MKALRPSLSGQGVGGLIISLVFTEGSNSALEMYVHLSACMHVSVGCEVLWKCVFGSWVATFLFVWLSTGTKIIQFESNGAVSGLMWSGWIYARADALDSC